MNFFFCFFCFPCEAIVSIKNRSDSCRSCFPGLTNHMKTCEENTLLSFFLLHKNRSIQPHQILFMLLSCLIIKGNREGIKKDKNKKANYDQPDQIKIQKKKSIFIYIYNILILSFLVCSCCFSLFVTFMQLSFLCFQFNATPTMPCYSLHFLNIILPGFECLICLLKYSSL